MNKVYLDNAATTKVDEKVVGAMIPYFGEKYGNASSVHLMGGESRRAIEDSRDVIAKAIGAKYKEIIFTGSGTESNNFVLKGLFFSNYPEKDHIITTKIEHDCILNACKWLEKQGAKITYLNVDSEGFVNPEDVRKAITHKTLVVSIIHGNNEVGTIQDLEAIGKICKEKNVYFHTDACQSFTKTKLDVNKFNLDFVTLNAHKIHGPKGVGVLYIKEGKGFRGKITPLLHGGGHEYGLRSSTENVPGIVGFAKAVQIASSSDVKNMSKLRDYIIEKILEIQGTKLNGSKGEKRLCNNINVSFGNIEGEAIGGYLDAKGICISTGSACSSKSLEPSHVLLSLGKDAKEANSSVRITISKYTTKQEVDYFLENLRKTVESLRKISPF
jgi:cysteine desulfurase